MEDTVGLTGLQLSILEVLWERGEATTQDVWAHIRRARPLALTTVATLMSRLERKRVLEHRIGGGRARVTTDPYSTPARLPAVEEQRCWATSRRLVEISG